MPTQMPTLNPASPAYEHGSKSGTSTPKMPHVDFDNDGKVGQPYQIGLAIHALLDITNIGINNYRIEWFSLSGFGTDLYAKSRMVATSVFPGPQMVGEISYMSACILMELGTQLKVVQVAGNDAWRPGVLYRHGTYVIHLLIYGTPSNRSAHNRTFHVVERLTICTIEPNMRHFVFLPYTTDGRWKGCGGRTIHCWAVFVCEGYLINEKSIEDPDRHLDDEFTFTYPMDGRATWECVCRGWWVSHNPVKDKLVLESMFSDRRPTYLLPSRPNVQ